MRLLHSIHFKIAAGVIATIVLLSTLYLVWDYRFYRSQLLGELEKSADDLSTVTLQGLLELAMIGEHPEMLQQAMERLGAGSSVASLFILDEEGQVRFSSNSSDVGRRLSTDENGCRECHALATAPTQRSVFYEEAAGGVMLRRVTLVPNRTECHSCHDPERPYNGVLVVDFPTTAVWAKLQSNLYEMLLKGGLTVFSILLVLGILMNKLVIRRLQKLSRATALLNRNGEDPELADLEGSDEIGQLAQSFSRMATRVRSYIGELRSQKTYLQDLIDGLVDLLLVVDRDLHVELANRAAARMWEEKELRELFSETTSLPATRSAIQKTFRFGKPTTSEAGIGQGETRRHMEVFCSPLRSQTGEVVRVIALFRDITERKLFEAQLSRAERLASVGQLAAGVAHEINNPMAAVSTCVEGLIRHLDDSSHIAASEKEEITDYLSTIGEAASRCKEITQRLLSASAEREGNFERTDLIEIVRHVVSLLEHEAEQRKIRITTDVDSHAAIFGNREKLCQLLMNLLLNSLEAVNGGGDIQVSVRADAPSCELRVTDNGHGIPEQNLERIFDPFFTTKREGRGTGLGLSICERIVRQHRAQIYVDSKEGEGTCFSVLFPLPGGTQDA